MVVLIICYNRPHNLKVWEQVWEKMDTTGCELVFAITSDLEYETKHEVVRYPNIGMDIGALKRFIDSESGYGRLWWCPDDFLPLRADLFQLYDTADVVGTFWSTQTSPHIRSGGVAVTEQVAKALVFPPTLLTSREQGKANCYAFEHLRLNFYKKLKYKFSIKMVDGTIPPNSPHWASQEPQYLFDTEFKEYACPF